MLILAIGNAGGNIAETIYRETKYTKLKEALFVFADCDENDLKKHMIYNCQLMYLHLRPDQKEFPINIFNGIESLIIIAGMGGGTGTRFVEQAALDAIRLGVKEITVVVTLPFNFEGDNRAARSVSCIERLKYIANISLIVFKNENLFDKYRNLDFFAAFNSADKDVMKVVEDVFSKQTSTLANKGMLSRVSEDIPKTMYVFSTADRFKYEIRDKIQMYFTNISRIEIYLFMCEEVSNPELMGKALTLQLKVPIKIETINKVLNPPAINCHDVIIDAIANDTDLQPLKGGFLALEEFISKSDAVIQKI